MLPTRAVGWGPSGAESIGASEDTREQPRANRVALRGVERRPLQVVALGEANTRGVALSSCAMRSEAAAGWKDIKTNNMAARAVAMFAMLMAVCFMSSIPGLVPRILPAQ